MSKSLTSVEASLHKHSYRSHAQFKILWGDVGGVPDDEGQRFHTLNQRLGVVVTQVLTQGQTVLVHQRIIQLSLGADRSSSGQVQVVLTHLEIKRHNTHIQGV